MKPARERESVILEQDGVVFGVILAGDYTAEHENGIDDIRRVLGLPTKPFGFTGRCITEPYTNFEFTTGQKTDTVYLADDNGGLGQSKKVKSKTATLALDEYAMRSMESRVRRYMAATDFIGAWNWQGFGITGFDKAGIAVVELLAEGLRTGDFALWVGGGNLNPFSRGGLVLVRPSLVPQDLKDTMDHADQDAKRLQDAAEKTGIFKRLEKAGCKYFACSPRWLNNMETRQPTKHDIIFWLNPMQQGQNNYGWFTVEELDQWTNGKGPVPK